VYIFFCLIQFFFSKYINICGIFPNFILIAIVYFALSKNIVNAQLISFLFGLTWDVLSTDIFGIRIIAFVILGYFVNIFGKNFDKNKTFAQIVIIFFSNIIYSLIFSLFYYILYDNNRNCKVTLLGIIRIIFTSLIAPLVFCILDNWLNKSSID
jgi:rod shape-determining protein MreD